MMVEFNIEFSFNLYAMYGILFSFHYCFTNNLSYCRFWCTDHTKQIEKGQLFIESIMKPYEDVPNSDNMRVLRDVLSLEGEWKKNVILRGQITEEFWQKVIDATKQFRVCALGTPGIGKTSSTCILIRLLLEQKQRVMYRVRRIQNNGFIYIFIPSLGTSGKLDVTVKVIRENVFDYLDEEVNKPSTYYIVDPGQTKNSCNLDNDFIGKVIIVASPDDRHWGGNDFKKERDGVVGTFLVLPVWNLFALLNARPYVNPNLTEDDLEDRFQKVGGIPRYIFTSNASFQNTLDDQKLAINSLSNEQLRLLTLGDVSAVQTFEEGQPKSILMVYDSSDSNFEKFNVAVSSRCVLQLLVKKHEKILWNVIVDQGGARGSITWQLFEVYCENRMLRIDLNNYFDYKYHDGTKLQKVTDVPVLALQLGNCTTIKGTRESLIVAAKRKGNDNILFYSSDQKYPFIDFLYRNGNTLYAFQATIGEKHTCKPYQLKAAIDEAGKEYEFLLHYLTFDKKYDNFQLDPVNPFKGDNSIFVRSSMTNNWTLKVIRVPSPYEEHGGPSQQRGRIRPQKELLLDEIKEIINLVLNTDASNGTVNFGELKVVELKNCLRAINLPLSGNKQDLIQRLQIATQFSFPRVATESTNQAEPNEENDADTGNGKEIAGDSRSDL